jgi:hypothetical protein
MSYKLLFVLNAVVVFAFGLALIVVPTTILALFVLGKIASTVFMAQALGAALASLGLVLWFAKDADDTAQKNLGMAALAGSVLGLIVTVIGLAGPLKGYGWVAIIVEVLFGLGYAFMLFLQPKMK